MKNGNVLVLGDSGVGKSTLINAVLGEHVTVTGYGSHGTTNRLEIFENEEIGFRLIDSVGFEPDFLKRRKAIAKVRDWSKAAAKVGDANSEINVIWFCVDGTSRKLFPRSIDSLVKSASVFKSVPVIVVITKSYSETDRAENIEMVRSAFAKYRKKLNLVGIIPVVAEIYRLNDQAFAAQDGLDELIDTTVAVMPEGLAAASRDIAKYQNAQRNNYAHAVVGASTAAGVTVGAVPIPFQDAVVLSGIEAAEVSALARIYGIKKSDRSQDLIKKIVEIGTVSAVARAACGAIIDAVPVAGWIVNAAVAGSFVAAIGEGSRFIFEQIALGNRSVEDLAWVEEILSEKLSAGFTDKVRKALSTLSDKSSKADVGKAITQVFNEKDDQKQR